MKNFKNYPPIAAGIMIIMALILVPVSESMGDLDGLKYLVAVTQMKAQTASDQALEGAENQRKLVKQQELLRSSSGSGGVVAGDNKQRQQPGRLTARELAREKAVLQQLEANAKRAAEVLENVKRVAAELDRQPRR